MIQKAVAHLNLYDWTFTTWEAMSELGILEQNPARQAVACAWMQSHEPDDIERMVEQNTARGQIDAFRFKFPLVGLNEAIEWFNVQSKAVADSQVDVVSMYNLTDWTFTTWESMSKLGILEQSPARQAVACVWLQSHGPDEVERMTEKGTAIGQINTFRQCMPLTALNSAIEWFNSQSKAVADSQVDVVPRPNSTDSGAPGNS